MSKNDILNFSVTFDMAAVERKVIKNALYRAMYGGIMRKIRFIGGPLDGQTRDIQSPGSEWRMYSPNYVFSAQAAPSPYDTIGSIREEVYIRGDYGVQTDGNLPYRYTLYFYAGVRRPKPSIGDTIRYNGETYIVDDIEPSSQFLATQRTFEATRPLRAGINGSRTIAVEESAIYWSRSAEAYSIRSGTQVRIEDDIIETAP